MNTQQLKQSVNVMYYITGVFLVCNLPSLIIYVVYWQTASMDNVGTVLIYAGNLANTLVLLNSALNPLIYCWRIEEIRNALLQLLRRQSQ